MYIDLYIEQIYIYKYPNNRYLRSTQKCYGRQINDVDIIFFILSCSYVYSFLGWLGNFFLTYYFNLDLNYEI